jgi:nitroreductase
MDVETAIRTRRTHKAYGAEPVDDDTVRELLELATFAPNHNLTNPWRFRVLGPQARERLRTAADALQAGSGAKLDRAPTLIAVSALTTGEAPEEDRDATAVAAYLVLLGAHARGIAGYWRTPAVLSDPAGRAALGIGDDEVAIALLHLGPPRQAQHMPERAPVDEIASFLD